MKPDRVVVLRLYGRNADHKTVINWIEKVISRDSRGRPNIAPALMEALLNHIGSRSVTKDAHIRGNNASSTSRGEVPRDADAISSVPIIPEAEDVLPQAPIPKDAVPVDTGKEKSKTDRFSTFVLDVQRQLDGGT